MKWEVWRQVWGHHFISRCQKVNYLLLHCCSHFVHSWRFVNPDVRCKTSATCLVNPEARCATFSDVLWIPTYVVGRMRHVLLIRTHVAWRLWRIFWDRAHFAWSLWHVSCIQTHAARTCGTSPRSGPRCSTSASCLVTPNACCTTSLARLLNLDAHCATFANRLLNPGARRMIPIHMLTRFPPTRYKFADNRTWLSWKKHTAGIHRRVQGVLWLWSVTDDITKRYVGG